MGFGDRARSFVNAIPGVGGLTTALFGDPAQEAHARAMREASSAAAKRRPELMNSRLQALSQMSQAFEPMNRLMAEYNGMGPNSKMMDIQSMIQNPMTQGMQDQMYQAAFGRNAPPAAPPPGFSNGQNPQPGIQPFGLPPLSQRK